MARYSVTLPIAGFAVVEVEADDELSAISEACDAVDISNIESWEAYPVLVEGNVFRGPQNRAEVELIEED